MFIWFSYSFFHAKKNCVALKDVISHNDMIKCRWNRPDKIHRIRESNITFQTPKISFASTNRTNTCFRFRIFSWNHQYVPWKITAYLLKLSQSIFFCPYGLAFLLDLRSFHFFNLLLLIVDRDVRDDNQTAQLKK